MQRVIAKYLKYKFTKEWTSRVTNFVTKTIFTKKALYAQSNFQCLFIVSNYVIYLFGQFYLIKNPFTTPKVADAGTCPP